MPGEDEILVVSPSTAAGAGRSPSRRTSRDGDDRRSVPWTTGRGMVARDVLCEDAGWWRRSQASRDGDGVEGSEGRPNPPRECRGKVD